MCVCVCVCVCVFTQNLGTSKFSGTFISLLAELFPHVLKQSTPQNAICPITSVDIAH